MNLIFTYDGSMGKLDNTNEKRIILINYYILSITNAKKLGYNTIIYVTSESKDLFIDIANDVIIVNEKYNTKLWDYLKIYVLENRSDEFVLIDGDVILNKKLPNTIEDILFDTYEIPNWELEYYNTVKLLNDLGIQTIIPYWSVEKRPVMNLGILHIRNEKLKYEYISKWKIINQWINTLDIELDLDKTTMVVSQFLITLISDHMKLSRKYITKHIGDESEYYTHYCGNIKFVKQIVTSEKIIKSQKSLI
jgi:hypothetical protein